MTLLQAKKRTKLYLTSTGLYDIPQDWFSEKLGAIIENLQSGFASGQRDNNGIVQLRMNNISNEGRFNFEELLKVPVPSDIENFRLQKDDIIFNNTNSLDLIGKTAIVDEAMDYTFSNHLTRIRVNKGIMLSYWLYLIFSRYKERSVFKAICNTHVGQSGIGKTELKNLQIFFPPIIEQRKIASILQKVDELIQKTDQVIEQTQRLKKGLMQRLLTKGIGHTKFKETSIGRIPDNWEVSTIGEECRIGSGGTPSRRIPEYFKGNTPWVKTNELNYNRITATEESITETALRNSSAKVYPKGTFVVAMIGLEAEKTMGRCAILGINAAVNQACAAIEPTGRLSVLFLFYYYQTLRNRIMSLMAGTKRLNLNLELVKSIEIPIPAQYEQDKITSIISDLDTILQKKYDYQAKLQNLKKGLMQKLLTGKIRVKA